jgi:hypothetical protein
LLDLLVPPTESAEAPGDSELTKRRAQRADAASKGEPSSDATS